MNEIQAQEIALQGLRRIWGYDNFRHPQGEIVTGLLMGQDSVVMLPTGAGKSLCFQLPACLVSGLTLVVTPLVSLMENQVQELQALAQPAALFHSQLSSTQRRQTLQQLEHRRLKLLYLSPESLLSRPIWQRLMAGGLMLRYLIVDEAHCIRQWGTSFRPMYRRLGAVRAALPSTAQPTVAAFTATADRETQQDLMTTLQLDRPRLMVHNPYRSNLVLRVKVTCTPAMRRQAVWHFLQAQGDTSGLIYTRSRRDSESLAAWLSQRQVSVAAYHAGLAAGQRRALEAAWLTGQLSCVVCTSAFGMGINRSNVRWICHLHPPLTLTEYVQEIGRAGRDGQPAETLLLVSEPTGWLDPQDRRQRQYFQHQLQRQVGQAYDLIAQLPQAGNVEEIQQRWPRGEMALACLHSMGLLQWRDPFHYVLRRSIPTRRHCSTALLSLNSRAMQSMVHYIRSRTCRWRTILELFGFHAQTKGFLCGHCDRCRSGSDSTV